MEICSNNKAKHRSQKLARNFPLVESLYCADTLCNSRVYYI